MNEKYNSNPSLQLIIMKHKISGLRKSIQANESLTLRKIADLERKHMSNLIGLYYALGGQYAD